MGEGTPACMSAVKISLEGSWGAGGAATLIPVTGVSLTSPHEQILDQGFRGIPARDFGAYMGPVRAEASLEGLAFAEALEPLVNRMLGASGGAGAYELGSSPSSLTIAVSDGSEAAYEGRGLMMSELSIRFSAAEGAVTYSASLIGKEIASVSTFAGPGTVEDPFLGWMASASLAGISAELIEGEWTFSREIGLLYTATGGANPELPSNAYAGPLEVTARATFDFSEAALVESYLDKDQGQYAVTFTNPSPAATLAITMVKADLGDGPFEVDRTGVFTTLAYSMRAIYEIGDDTFVTVVFG